MMRKDWIIGAIGLYLFLMSVYWFLGRSTEMWAYFYYLNEKYMCMLGFLLLHLNTRSRFIKSVAAYCIGLCLFMIAYFFFTRFFGHSNWLTVGSLLIYSFVFLVIIRSKS